MYAICQRNQDHLNKVGDAFKIDKRYTSYEDLLKDRQVDFVHINSPIPDHGAMSIAALKAGKHVMCTVPMATTIEECQQIVELVKKTGLKYMMAETVVYSRGVPVHQGPVRERRAGQDPVHGRVAPAGHGRLARILAAHDPDALRDARRQPGARSGQRAGGIRLLLRLRHDPRRPAKEVRQQVRRRIVPHQDQGFRRRRPHLAFPLRHRRQYRESFDVYGTKKSFEWTLVEHEEHIIHTAKKPENEIPQRVKVPRFRHLLPEEIRKFTSSIQDTEHLSFIQGAGHGGSIRTWSTSS